MISNNDNDNDATTSSYVLEANVNQREQLLGWEGQVGIVTFLQVKEGGDISNYLQANHGAVEDVDGTRITTLRVDQLWSTMRNQQGRAGAGSGGSDDDNNGNNATNNSDDDVDFEELFGSFAHATIDVFPTAEALIQAHDSINENRLSNIQSMYSLTFDPTNGGGGGGGARGNRGGDDGAGSSSSSRASNRASNRNNVQLLNKATEIASRPIFQPLFRYIAKHKLDTKTKTDPKENYDVLKMMGISAESLDLFLSASQQQQQDQDQQPFCVFTLEKQLDKERYGKDVTDIITKPTLLNMVALGGSYQSRGMITGTWIGSAGNPTKTDTTKTDSTITESLLWEDFTLEVWPSRTAYQIGLANISKNIATASQKFITNKVQLLCTPLFEINECGVAI